MQVLLVLFRNPLFWIGTASFLALVYFYNRLVKARMQVDSSFKEIENVVNRRRNLIPFLEERLLSEGLDKPDRLLALLNKIKHQAAAMPHHQSLLQQVSAERLLTQQFKEIKREMMGGGKKERNELLLTFESKYEVLEQQLHIAGNYYNTSVKEYNYLLDAFPSGLLAAILNFDKAEYFLLTEPEG